MFSSSGRDTSSWVHTKEHGKGQSLVPNPLPHYSHPVPAGGYRGTRNFGWMSPNSSALRARASTISPPAQTDLQEEA